MKTISFADYGLLAFIHQLPVKNLQFTTNKKNGN